MDDFLDTLDESELILFHMKFFMGGSGIEL